MKPVFNLLKSRKGGLNKYRIILILIGFCIIFILSPFFQFAKSILIMFPYTMSEKKNSLLTTENITINMPGGYNTFKKDWYPFVMIFNDDRGLISEVGREVKLTIMYNFGAFDLLKGSSTFYDAKSDYLNAFYGAYIVKDEEKMYGFNDDATPDLEDIKTLLYHDMSNLVLYSIGKTDATFNVSDVKTFKEDDFLGYDDWDVIDATLRTNSPMHKYKDNHRAYTQYGKPYKKDYNGVDFEEIDMGGKIYFKYFPEKKCSIFFYVIAQSEKVVNDTYENFIRKTGFSIE